jgi:hypothetical protein
VTMVNGTQGRLQRRRLRTSSRTPGELQAGRLRLAEWPPCRSML